MKARNKKNGEDKSKSPKSTKKDLSANKENLEHRIRALKKIIEQIKDEGKNHKASKK